MTAAEIYKKALHALTPDAAAKVVQQAMHEVWQQACTEAAQIARDHVPNKIILDGILSLRDSKKPLNF